jgi:hypothetical protein
MLDDSRGGNDQVTGSFDFGSVYGDAQSISGHSRAGNDSVAIYAMNGAAYGDAETLSDYAVGGNDIVVSTDALVSSLYGDARAFNDHAKGGNDRLVSGVGSDSMWGDAREMSDSSQGGRDVFVFKPGNGNDYIYDFHHGQDLVELHSFTQQAVSAQSAESGPASFSDLSIEVADVNQDGIKDSIIHFNANNSVAILSTDLAPSDVIFATDAPSGGLTVRVSEDAWLYHPNAQFVVKVDGVQVGEVQTATALHTQGQNQEVTFGGDFSNAKQVTVEFLNDQYGGPNEDVNLYVESVSLDGVVFSGSQAKIDPAVGMSVGSSAVLTHNGTATFNVAPDTLVVQVSEDAWAYHPNAQFALTVDGKQVGEARSVTALHAQGQSDTFSFTGDFSQGHQVAITLLNDQYGGLGQDVNLYIDSISLNGQTIEGSEAILDGASGTYSGTSAELFRNGSAVFNVDDLHHADLLM